MTGMEGMKTHGNGDIVFLVNSSRYKAQRETVANASNVFHAMLEGHFKESIDNEIVIHDIEHDDNFRRILDFISKDNEEPADLQTLSTEEISELLKLTDYFNMQVFLKDIENYLSSLQYHQITLDTVVSLINIAKLHGLDKLYKRAKRFIFANTHEIIHHSSFLDTNHDVLACLLKSDNFCANERDVLMAVLQWYHVYTCGNSNATDTKDDENDNEKETNDANFERNSHEIKIGQFNDKDFSSNILVGLLAHVRFSFITFTDFFKSFINKQDEMTLFNKYQDIISSICFDTSLFSSVARFYITDFSIPIVVKNFGETEVGSVFSDMYLARGLEWTLNIRWLKEHNTFGVYLYCKYLGRNKNWRCEAKFDYYDEWAYLRSKTHIFSAGNEAAGYTWPESLHKKMTDSTSHGTYVKDKKLFELTIHVDPKRLKFA